MRSGGGRQDGTLPRTPEGSTTAGIDGQEASSWLSLPLLAQRRHRVIGMSPQDTVSPTPDPVTTGEKVRELMQAKMSSKMNPSCCMTYADRTSALQLHGSYQEPSLESKLSASVFLMICCWAAPAGVTPDEATGRK